MDLFATPRRSHHLPSLGDKPLVTSLVLFEPSVVFLFSLMSLRRLGGHMAHLIRSPLLPTISRA
ncbi:hypothetical protein SCLCIDRAFT_1214323 [Scleroderma citrinum Foug A]|uniref:Uncharacterized protein n=1 Tax=Scleroderma citrinum Foug A TaxID=1036808 RepID=A0A0C3E424_9AGAM|nr:hypothetical protein SCLCIDRAFT_1214323 [Scleroderma citrinum Foug A]